MSIYRPQPVTPPLNEDTSPLAILTPGSQPVIYEWNDNYGSTLVQTTPNPNAGDNRVVTNNQ